MPVDRKLPGSGFWGQWVLVSALGVGLGAFLGMCLAWGVVGVEPTGETTPKFFSMAYFDTMRASIALGRDDPIGELSGGRDLRYSAFYAPGGEFFMYTVMIALGGLTQWLFLRRRLAWARWWVLPVPLYFGFVYLTKENVLAVGGGIWLVPFIAKDFALLGALSSAIVGIPLVWLLRRSHRKI